MSHTHLCDSLQYDSLQAQIFLPAALKMRMMLVMWQSTVTILPLGIAPSTLKVLFPPVRPGHCQQLHPFIFKWWEENFTQRFLSHPYQQNAGTVWA